MRFCGTRSKYAGGCRCDECRNAAARYKHRQRHGDAQFAHPCWFCGRTFRTYNGARVHIGRVH